MGLPGKSNDSGDDGGIAAVQALIGRLTRAVLEIVLRPVFLMYSVIIVRPITAVRRVLWRRRGLWHWLWARIAGKATMQKRLRGNLIAVKEDVLHVGFELFATQHRRARVHAEAEDAGEGEPSRFTPTIGQFQQIIDAATASEVGTVSTWVEDRAGGDDRATPDGGGKELESPPATGSTDLGLPRNTAWVVTTMRLLNKAEDELRRDTETAYRAYLRARRYLMHGKYLLYHARTSRQTAEGGTGNLNLGNPVQAEARLVYEEAVANARDGQVLGAVRELLCKENEAGDVVVRDDISMTELDAAMHALNKRRVEEYRLFEDFRVSIFGFLTLSALLLAGMLVVLPGFMGSSIPAGIVATVETFLPENQMDPNRVFFVLVLVFGALGAAISGIRNAKRDPVSVQSSDKILGRWLPVVRMTIGAISAFIVSIFLFSDVINEDVLSVPLVLGAALAAGFSERLVIRAISSFEQRTMPDAELREQGDGR